MPRRKSQRIATATAATPQKASQEEEIYHRPVANSSLSPQPPAPQSLKISPADGLGVPSSRRPIGPAANALAPTVAAHSETKRRPWNALRRYYSQSSSFPDYGSPKSAMGADSLVRYQFSRDYRQTEVLTGAQRQMNLAFGPVNTLTGTGKKREVPDSSSPSTQSLVKRQRREKQLVDGLSPESINQKSPSSSRQSFGAQRQADEANVRQPLRQFTSKVEVESHVNGHEPPPADAVSDLAPDRRTRKRPSTVSNSSPPKVQAKRHKTLLEKDEIETSEDELQIEHPKAVAEVRRTNFSNVGLSPRSRRTMRGDITPTRFKPSQIDTQEAGSPLDIIQAVSGKHTYAVDDVNAHPCLSLHQSVLSSELEARSGGKPNKAYVWLSFNPKNVNIVRYGGSYITLRRPMTADRPAMLALQFASPEGAALVVQMIGAINPENKSREEMENCMDHAWKRAEQRSQPVRQDRPKIQTLSSIEVTDENSSTIHQQTESLTGKPRKLKDSMTNRPEKEKERKPSPSPPPLLGMETRRTRRSSLLHKETIHIFERWSEKNTDWEENWKQTLVYPATGRNRASVDKEDILRLDEGEFLNDNLINFYLRYLQTKLETERPDLLKRVHIFSTFFFEKLTSNRGTINYDGVKNWTAKLDLFSYDYIVVPVNENAHWYLAVICNAPRLLEAAEVSLEPAAPSMDALGRPRPETRILKTVEREMSDISLEDGLATRRSLRQRASSPLSAPLVPSSPETLVQEPPRAPSRRNDGSNPRIVTMDSLGSRHGLTCRALKNYLVLEAKDKKAIDLVTVPGGMKARGIPEQNNFCDCGVFVLAYMEEFLRDPDELMRKILTKENLDWTINPMQLRVKVRDLLFGLQQEQSERLAKERSEKKRLRRERLSGSSSPVSVAEVKPQHDPKEGRADKKEDARVASVSPDEPNITLERSLTPPPRAHLNRSTIRDSQGNSSEDEAVNMVKMVPESHMETPDTNGAEASSLRQTSMRHATSRSARSPPPSSSTLSDATKIDDTQRSVIVLPTITNA